MTLLHNRNKWFNPGHLKTCGPMVQDKNDQYYCPKCEWRKSGESGNARWVVRRDCF